MTKNIKETKEVIEFLVILANAVAESLRDGKFNWLDFGAFFALIPQMGPAVNGIVEVPAELADLTEDERAEIVELIQNRLAIAPVTNEIAVRSADLALHFAELVAEIKRLKEQNA